MMHLALRRWRWLLAHLGHRLCDWLLIHLPRRWRLVLLIARLGSGHFRTNGPETLALIRGVLSWLPLGLLLRLGLLNRGPRLRLNLDRCSSS